MARPQRDDWTELTGDTAVEGDKQITTRTDQLALDQGVLYRTIVRVRRGPDVVAISVATTFVPFT